MCLILGAIVVPAQQAQTANYIPVFTNNSGGLGNSTMYESSGNIGVGTTTPTAPFSVVNSGVFTNTNQETPYLQALINGININGMLSSGSGCCSNIDAISGGILMPYNKNNPATVTTGNGVAGYADNDCETGESGNHCNVTGGFFYGRASANGA